MTPTQLRHQRARRTVDAVRRVAEEVTHGEDLFDQVAARLRAAIPFDGELWLGADPATGLATAPVRIENIEAGHCDSYWHREFLVEDALLFRDLARAERPVASLRATVPPARSARFREFLAPQGYDDELRAAFRVEGETWGYVSLLRERGRPPFTEEEAAIVGELSAPLAQALRASTVMARSLPGRPPEAPGLMVFDERGRLLSLDDGARAWLDELPAGPLTVGEVPLPTQVTAAVSRARALAEGRGDGQARVRLRSRTGRWLVIHASCLRLADGAPGQTALVIQPARAAEVAPLIVRGYELSPREQQITGLIARGAATGEIAKALFLSPHTVRDHVKAVFEKVGVSSRGELVAKVFAEHYAPALHAAAA